MKCAGWSGAMSLPRVLSLSAEGELVCAPLAEIARLRGEAQNLEKAGQLSCKVAGGRLEILARVQPDAEGWSGVQLAAGKSADELIRIGWDGLKAKWRWIAARRAAYSAACRWENPGRMN